MWMKQQCLRDKLRFLTSTYYELLEVYEDADYKNFLRINNSFFELLDLLRPKIEKKETHIRNTNTTSAEDSA